MSVSPSLVIDMMWSLIMDWIEEGSSKGSGDMGVSEVRSAPSGPFDRLRTGTGGRAEGLVQGVVKLGDQPGGPGFFVGDGGGRLASRRCVVVVGLGGRVGV